MTPEEASALHDRNWIATFVALADAQPRGFALETPTVRVAASGIPIMNKVIVTDPDPRPEDLEAALALVREHHVAYDVFVRATWDRALTTVAATGLARGGEMPCLVSELPIHGVSLPPGLQVRRIAPAEIDDFRAVARDGFEMPDPLVAAAFRSDMLEMTGLRAFVGYAGGQPVACAASYLTGDVIGIYTVATVAAARGRGYGTAVTAAAMAGTDARAAALQASEVGQPVYERMGYRVVHHETIFREGSPA
ncbi:MAG: GNAT family N-acetyltransferase [Chloroflexota bacterium]